MYKKFLIFIGILLLSVNIAVATVIFSKTTKAEYQRRYNNLLNKAATYTTISAADKALYQQHMNDNLNEIEKMMNDSSIPNEIKMTVLKALNESISTMESELNNPNIPISEKIAGIKEAMKSIKTNFIEYQNTKQEQEWKEKLRADQRKKEETLQKAQAEEWESRIASIEKAQKQNELNRKTAQAERNEYLEWRKRHDELLEARKNTICNIVIAANSEGNAVLCFASRKKAYLTYHSKVADPNDNWAEADYACKLQDMSLPSREQWKILVNINKYLSHPFSPSEVFWTSEVIDSNSAYTYNPHSSRNTWFISRRDKEFVGSICVKEFKNYQEIIKK